MCNDIVDFLNVYWSFSYLFFFLNWAVFWGVGGIDRNSLYILAMSLLLDISIVKIFSRCGSYSFLIAVYYSTC